MIKRQTRNERKLNLKQVRETRALNLRTYVIT